MDWQINDSYIVGHFGKNKKNINKFSCFDLDGTLIVTKSTKKFAIDEFDWKFKFDNVVKKLRDLHDGDYKIVIFTNQMGLMKRKDGISKFQHKINAIAKELNIPLTIFASLHDDYYRKPNPTMFNMLTDGNTDIDRHSFFCGDACGVNSFSDTDLKFALNCKLKFYSDEYFDGQKSITYKVKYPEISHTGEKINFKLPEGKCVIIMNGPPGSGKTRFVHKYIERYGYKIINRDTIPSKTIGTCLKKCKQYLESDDNIVIDNTNPSILSRKPFIDLAKEYDYKVWCTVMDTPIEIAKHNAHYRNYISHNEIKNIPEVVYRVYKSKMQPPTEDEEIDNIVHIPFVVDDDAKADENYKLYFF